jgi:collagenase-like PrtC family protease
MKLTVPTNWQEDLLERIRKPEVDIVYGKLDRDFVGGGRPSVVLNKITKSKAKSHIQELHKMGLIFYYLLNSSCMANRELTRSGQDKLIKLLHWLSESDVDGVVVASPFLLEFIKRKYPNFKLSISCFANVNSVEKARFWEDLGASVITLSQVETNRNFGLLEKIRENVKCELQLLVNDNCLQDCPLFFYHNNMTSHASQDSSRKGSYIFDYCRLMCRSRMLKEPVNFIRAAWIRPEDLHIYENIGIDRFKLVDRSMHSDALALIVDAYSKRRYDGNLYDLFNNPSKSLWLNKPNFLHRLNYFFHPFAVNIFKILKHKEVVKDIDVYIDNTKLDGFINYFLNQDCRYRSCKDCGYCQEIADKVVKINHEATQKDIYKYDALLREIISGDIYRY